MKSATDVMQDVIFSAVIDALEGFKAASRGVPNVLARDVGAVHRNTTPADLPTEVRAAVEESVRQAFGRLRREGYAVAPADAARDARPPRPRPPGDGPRGPSRRAGAPVVETKRRPPTGPRGGPARPPKKR